MAFVHLHVHSEYSLLDGACRVGEMAETAKAMGQTALAITDHGVMYGAVAFFKAAEKAGIQPIIGCEVYVAPVSRHIKQRSETGDYTHLILLCKNETGYHNLCYLVSCGFTEGFYVRPRIDWDLLSEHSEGLICLSGCLAGEIPRLLVNGRYDDAKARAVWLAELFGEGNFYLELQDHGLSEERIAREGLLRISRETGIPTVLTNDAHYLKKEDAYYQDVLMCIQMGKTVHDTSRMKFESDDYYLKSEEEMRALLPEELQEAADNTNRIAEQCRFRFEFGHYHLPLFQLPEGETDGFAYLSRRCFEGLRERYAEVTETLEQQLRYELDMICRMGFTDYFLIVSDFIGYAKRKGIPVGPGRGSAAGSLVSYCLHITDIDPIKYKLFFERFLNPERISMPDIDVDFCVNRRAEVIEYVNRKYGSDHVAQIVTFGTLAARGAIRDVGRVLDLSYAECDAVAKQIPMSLGITLKEALAVSKPLRDMMESDPRIAHLIETAQALEGMPRHASTHAAGVVITQNPVYDYVPLAKNDESVVCQYQMTTLEELGLLKMDFLGLRTLTVLEDAAKLVRREVPDFDVAKVPENDAAVFEMLTQGRTVGVFQLESAGITAVCTGLKPRSIEDITAIIALYRPGPMDSIPRFLEGSRNPASITYKHPMLREILDVTYGCIVYQEQVIEIFRKMAGFSLGQADMIRRAMSKKKETEIKKERTAFIHGDEARGIDGAVKRGVSEEIAGGIYDEILDFANYAFNKAHAVSYAIVTYRTAYMKCHYPRQYMAALLTSVLGDMKKTAGYIAECRDCGIALLPPDINESDADFTAQGENIRFGLAAIKNVGRAFVLSLMEERRTGGRFCGLEDFCRRMASRELNRRALESMIRAGAFDCFGAKRSQLLAVLDTVIEGTLNDTRHNIVGQIDFFSLGEETAPKRDSLVLPEMAEFSPRERMAMEKEATGLYLSGHPMDEYREALRRAGVVRIGRLLDAFSAEGDGRFRDGQEVLVAGIVSSAKTKTTRNGGLMAYITLEDDSGTMELLAFQRALDMGGGYLRENSVVLVRGKISVREEKDPQLMVDSLRPISDLDMIQSESKAHGEKTLWLRLPSREDPLFHRLELLLEMFPGEERLVVYFKDTGKKLSAQCLIHRSLLDELRERCGEENVVVK